MEKRKKNIGIDTLLYGTLFAISFLKGFGLAAGSVVYIAVYVLTFLITIISSFSRRCSKKELGIVLLVVSLGAIVFGVSGETTFLFSAILVIEARELNMKSVFKVLLISKALALVANITFSIVGIIPFHSLDFYREVSGGFISRYSFGYTHPNLFHASFTLIVILYCYLRSKRISLSEVIIVLLCNYGVFMVSQSRTNFLITIIYCILVLVFRRFKGEMKRIGIFVRCLLVCCILTSFLLAYAYDKIGIINSIDTLLTGRIRYMHLVFENYSIPLINRSNYEGIAFDNGFFDLFYNGGILIGALYIFLLLKTIGNAVKKNDKDALLLVVINLVFSMTESFFCNALMNPSLFLISGLSGTNLALPNDAETKYEKKVA